MLIFPFPFLDGIQCMDGAPCTPFVVLSHAAPFVS